MTIRQQTALLASLIVTHDPESGSWEVVQMARALAPGRPVDVEGRPVIDALPVTLTLDMVDDCYESEPPTLRSPSFAA